MSVISYVNNIKYPYFVLFDTGEGGRFLRGEEFQDLADAREFAEKCHGVVAMLAIIEDHMGDEGGE